MNEPHREFTTNRANHVVKVTAPRPTTPAAVRFAAMLSEQEAPGGFKTPCRIWQGCKNFKDDSGNDVSPRHYVLRMRGVAVARGAKVIILCKVAECCEHIRLKENGR